MRYEHEFTQTISFPIGGIGTGSFGIAGNGRFIDWEILNRPDKGSCWDFSHISVVAKKTDGKIIAKVLNGDMITGFMGENNGFGFGACAGTLCGIEHFENCVFEGDFPIAKLTFSDDDFPGKVHLNVFNPFIPLDAYNSSIPAGFFEIEFENPEESEIEYTAVFSMRNPFESGINTIVEKDGYKILRLGTDIDKEDIKYGDLSLLSDAEDIEIQRYWYRTGWNENIDVFIREITSGNPFIDRVYDTPGKGDVGSVAAHLKVASGEKKSTRFVLSWNAPNQENYWNKEMAGKTWKNYYATVFPSSADSAVYSMKNFSSLYSRTMLFKETLYDSSLDPAVIEAISATLSVLKTPTVLRLEDGSFYGWEGLHKTKGCCEGTCQHVWNYAYALCFLFPELERSIRDNEFRYCTEDTGKTVFRMMLPQGERKEGAFRACLDGQMGIIIKTYREWKISGDTQWLREVWPTVKKILAYAWSEENPDRWDLNKDGVLEGRQHHTLDKELFGPSGWLQGFYLAALKAAGEMAEYLGDTDCKAEYDELFQKGYQWTKDNLFNGEYFIQKVDLKDKSIIDSYENAEEYWYDEAEELKFQIGDGCEIDQLLGQWHANICGLGNLFDPAQKKKALESLYRYNYKPAMRNVNNTWRVFSLNDESGAIICEFPGEKPIIPLPYFAETMTGFEYALAGLMIGEGMEKEGLDIVKGIRGRYDGKKRNPWNEMECGSNYARAMASFALLPIYSGFKFDLPRKTIGFAPLSKDNFKCLFSVGTAWGSVQWNRDEIILTIKEGKLELEMFGVDVDAKELWIDGKNIDFRNTEGSIEFETAVVTNTLRVIM